MTYLRPTVWPEGPEQTLYQSRGCPVVIVGGGVSDGGLSIAGSCHVSNG